MGEDMANCIPYRGGMPGRNRRRCADEGDLGMAEGTRRMRAEEGLNAGGVRLGSGFKAGSRSRYARFRIIESAETEELQRDAPDEPWIIDEVSPPQTAWLLQETMEPLQTSGFHPIG